MKNQQRPPRRRSRIARLLPAMLPAAAAAVLLCGCSAFKEKNPEKVEPTPPPRAITPYEQPEQHHSSFWSWLPWVD